MNFECAAYQTQSAQWPQTGNVILAQFDSETIVVYQAYRPSIAEFAIAHGYLGGADFSFSRMSWIKPNFLWMMYRCGWGTKIDQERTLAIRIRREVFDGLLRSAVYSSFQSDIYADHETWKQAVAESQVRLQWDPDHDPTGQPLSRRAIQLGMRGGALKQFATDGIVEIQDISTFVSQQRIFATPERFAELQTPVEKVYPVSDPSVIAQLRLDNF